MSQVLEGEDTVTSFSKNKVHSKIFELVKDTVSIDRESFMDDLAEALNSEVEELPKVEAVVVISFGNSKITVPAFETTEEE
jgi:methionine synthase II (cobalamin-independent)